MKPGACVISSLLGQPSLTTISELSLRDELFLDYEDKEIFKYLCFQLKCGIKKPPTFEVMRSFTRRINL